MCHLYTRRVVVVDMFKKDRARTHTGNGGRASPASAKNMKIDESISNVTLDVAVCGEVML